MSELNIRDNYRTLNERLAPALNFCKTHPTHFLYLIKCDSSYKIGYAKNLWSRVNNIRCMNPSEVKLIASIGFHSLNSVKHTEEVIHNKLMRKHIRGEWFKLSDNDVKNIINEFYS